MKNEEVTIGDCRLILGDCREVLPTLPKVGAVVTDPPYGLRFMGKRWDYDVPDSDLWALVLDILSPGGHLLAFAGTRTQHRMAVRIEDAGFEIRDMLAWVYGSGFPKSMDVGKAIDRAAGAVREKVPATGGLHNNRNLNDDGWSKIGAVAPEMDSPAPATEAARQWDGWGTALKPAFEPITMARKRLEGTVAQNVQEHGTGALNIDGCRVDSEHITGWGGDGSALYEGGLSRVGGEARPVEGRWPANLIHDGSDEVVALFPQSKGQQGAVAPQNGARVSVNAYGDWGPRPECQPRGDSGSAARFFYCAKAAASERGAGNDHPTVKPIALMRWLLTLVTPPGGVVLDPFLGSGSTGVAAADLGAGFIGIELDRRYFDIACERISRAYDQHRLPLGDAR